MLKEKKLVDIRKIEVHDDGKINAHLTLRVDGRIEPVERVMTTDELEHMKQTETFLDYNF